MTEEQIISAWNLLAKKKLKEADAALRIAEDGVVVTSIEADTPLAQARVGLWQATKHYAAKEYDAARASLDAVDEWLRKAGETTDNTVKKEVDALDKKLAELKQKLAK